MANIPIEAALRACAAQAATERQEREEIAAERAELATMRQALDALADAEIRAALEKFQQ